jgi:hypothetical protein
MNKIIFSNRLFMTDVNVTELDSFLTTQFSTVKSQVLSLVNDSLSQVHGRLDDLKLQHERELADLALAHDKALVDLRTRHTQELIKLQEESKVDNRVLITQQYSRTITQREEELAIANKQIESLKKQLDAHKTSAKLTLKAPQVNVTSITQSEPAPAPVVACVSVPAPVVAPAPVPEESVKVQLPVVEPTTTPTPMPTQSLDPKAFSKIKRKGVLYYQAKPDNANADGSLNVYELLEGNVFGPLLGQKLPDGKYSF